MEGTDGGVGRGGRVLTVPDLLRRIEDGGEGLSTKPEGADRFVSRGSGVTTRACTGGVGSLRGESGWGEVLRLRSLEPRSPDGTSTYWAGPETNIVASTISCKSAWVCLGLRRGVKLPNTLRWSSSWLRLGLRRIVADPSASTGALNLRVSRRAAVAGGYNSR